MRLIEIEVDVNDVGLVVGMRAGCLAGRHVDGEQRRLVAAARVEHIQRVAVGAEIQRLGAVEIADRHGQKVLPAAVGAAHHVFGAAVGRKAHAEPQLKVAVGDEPGKFVVLEQQLARAGDDVDPEQVEVALVARVVPEQHLVGKFAVGFLPVRLDPALGRQRHDGAAGDIDAGGAPVLVAVALLEKNQMAVGVRPAIKSRQVAVGDMRHRARGAKIRQRRHEQIAHPADRRQPGQGLAVGADAHAADIGIVEENFSRDQIGFRRRRAAEARERQRGEGRGAAQEIAAVDRDHMRRSPGERSPCRQCAWALLPED